MKTLAIIEIKSAAELVQSIPKDFVPKRSRIAARAVAFDDDRNIYLMYATKDNYHKLPGGGVDPGESIVDALHREMLEEMGRGGEVVAEIGHTIQFDREEKFRQDSYSYLVHLSDEVGQPKLTKKEAAAGFELVAFATLDEAIKAVQSGKVSGGSSIILRDALILETARDLIPGKPVPARA